MSDQLKPPVGINLGNKEISRILHSLGGFGWTLNTEVLSLSSDNSMHLDTKISTRSGNLDESKFFHFEENKDLADHSDSLIFKGNQLIRTCPKLNISQVVASK